MAERLEPWREGDLPLLERLLGDPAMTEHLGGPESPEQLTKRQVVLEGLAESGKGRCFKIIDESTSDTVGSVMYWDRVWDDENVYEIGWSVLPAFQGRGIAARATGLAIDAARSDRKHRFLHAFPSVDNLPSNAICKKLGFTLIQECDFEYPRGSYMRCNDWRLDLFGED